MNWEEYLKQQQDLAQKQIEAVLQPTPAMRLAFYHSALLPNWRIQPEIVQKLDEAYVQNNFGELSHLCGHLNYLVSAIANEMRAEVAQKLAVECGKMKREEYKPDWWARD